MGPADSTADKTRIPGESLTDDGLPQAGDRRPLDRRDGPPDNLGQRMEGLPAGHPSSPYNADGTLRQPIPRLSDLETATETEEPDSADSERTNLHDAPDRHGAREPPDVTSTTDRPSDRQLSAADAADRTHPFTDEEWVEHVINVRTYLDKAHADGLATDHQFTIDPDRSRWTRDRRHLQGEIVDTLYEQAADVPNDHQAVVAGGLAGAGKTTVLSDHAGIDQSQYLTINPDDVKAEMAKRGMIPKVEGLSPMEASDLVHEESSYVARRLALRAQEDGKNIIWDITMSSRASTERRIDDLRGSDYTTISGIFVDIPIEVSATRADARHRKDQDAYEAGDGLGGRYIPPEVTAAQADTQWGSQNRKTFEELKTRFDQWARFDNGVDGHDPVMIETGPQDDNPEETPS